MLKKVISGGQTGVDQAALRAARYLDISTGGWGPHNWMTEYGENKNLLSSFGLRADRFDPSTYKVRTESNIDAADGTLILTWGLSSPGTNLSKSLCKKHKTHYLVMDNIHSGVAVYEVVQWIKNHDIRILNVAGPRESKIGKIPKEQTVNFLIKVFKALKNDK